MESTWHGREWTDLLILTKSLILRVSDTKRRWYVCLRFLHFLNSFEASWSWKSCFLKAIKAMCSKRGFKWNNRSFYAENTLLRMGQDSSRCLMIHIVRRPRKLHDRLFFMANDRLKSSAGISAEYREIYHRDVKFRWFDPLNLRNAFFRNVAPGVKALLFAGLQWAESDLGTRSEVSIDGFSYPFSIDDFSSPKAEILWRLGERPPTAGKYPGFSRWMTNSYPTKTYK